MTAGASTDLVLACQITTHLAESKRPSLKRLAVEVQAGEVTLSGSVGSFHEKQIAIQSCRMQSGIRRLIDAVKVASSF